MSARNGQDPVLDCPTTKPFKNSISIFIALSARQRTQLIQPTCVLAVPVVYHRVAVTSPRSSLALARQMLAMSPARRRFGKRLPASSSSEWCVPGTVGHLRRHEFGEKKQQTSGRRWKRLVLQRARALAWPLSTFTSHCAGSWMMDDVTPFPIRSHIPLADLAHLLHLLRALVGVQ